MKNRKGFINLTGPFDGRDLNEIEAEEFSSEGE